MSADHYEISILIGPCSQDEAMSANDSFAEFSDSLGLGGAVLLSRDPEWLAQQEVNDGLRESVAPRAKFEVPA